MKGLKKLPKPLKSEQAIITMTTTTITQQRHGARWASKHTCSDRDAMIYACKSRIRSQTFVALKGSNRDPDLHKVSRE